MIRSYVFVTAALLSGLAIQCKELRAADAPPAVDIRDSDGKPIITADQILSYDWDTHTITVAPDVRANLVKRLFESKRLVSGVPLSVAIDGNAIYQGNFTTDISSRSFATTVIKVDPPAPFDGVGVRELHIQLGYPGEKFFVGDDPRGDKRIQDALEASHKLAHTRQDRIRWVASALKEIETVKPGMTRGDLLRVFVEEGGLSGRQQRRYAYRDCPYIKVNVKFEAVEKVDERTELSSDKITHISTPFLEWSIGD